MGRSAAPAGASVVKEESKNEVAEKMAATAGAKNSLDDFLQVMAEEERKQLQATSGDLEVLRNVTPAQMREFQGMDANGRPTGQPGRLYGWSPKTRTAVVLKKAFLEKREELKK